MTGLQAALAVVAAIHLRERTGQGQFIDMAMHDALLAMQEAANLVLYGQMEEPKSSAEGDMGLTRGNVEVSYRPSAPERPDDEPRQAGLTRAQWQELRDEPLLGTFWSGRASYGKDPRRHER